MHSNHKGLTVVELIVAITLASLVIIAIIPSILGIVSGLNRQATETRVIAHVNTALSTIKLDSQRLYKLLNTTDMTDSESPAPSTGWSFEGSNSNRRTLISRLPATTAAYQDKARQLVYEESKSNCSTYDGSPVTYNTIFYVDSDRTLYKRIAMNSDTAGCPGQTPYQKTTCRTCTGPKDIVVAENVSQFKVEYHLSQDSKSEVNYSSLISSGLDDIVSATITIEVSMNGPNNKTVSHKDSLRINIHPLLLDS